MALRPKIDVKTEKVPINIPVELLELAKAYAKFLGGDTTVSYVFAEAARKEIHSDKAFRAAQEKREADHRGAAPGEEVTTVGRVRRRTGVKAPQLATETIAAGEVLAPSPSERT